MPTDRSPVPVLPAALRAPTVHAPRALDNGAVPACVCVLCMQVGIPSKDSGKVVQAILRKRKVRTESLEHAPRACVHPCASPCASSCVWRVLQVRTKSLDGASVDASKEPSKKFQVEKHSHLTHAVPANPSASSAHSAPLMHLHCACGHR